MQTTQAIDLAPAVRVTVAIDLIGDLDATLGAMFSETLTRLVDDGTTDVALMLKHIALSSEDGVAALGAALARARARGCSVAVDPGSRRMKATFAAARLNVAGSAASARTTSRHLMLARHALEKRLQRTA